MLARYCSMAFNEVSVLSENIGFVCKSLGLESLTVRDATEVPDDKSAKLPTPNNPILVATA